jgi:hypothetical protein
MINEKFMKFCTSFIMQSSHIMILNSTKFGGNQRKDVEVGPYRWTDRQINFRFGQAEIFLRMAQF